MAKDARRETEELEKEARRLAATVAQFKRLEELRQQVQYLRCEARKIRHGQQKKCESTYIPYRRPDIVEWEKRRRDEDALRCEGM